MKKITFFATVLFCSVVLVACGGGSEVADTPSNPSNPSNPGTQTPSADGKLVIDNGRGTSNNQDTEKPK